MLENRSEQKLALVTGASRGIGKGIAEYLISKGYKVVGTATSELGCAQIKQNLQALGPEHGAFVLNIADTDQVNAAISEFLAHHGTPYLVVNNAGITRDNLFLRMKDEEWLDVINTNLSGVYRVCKSLIKPLIKARTGRIINISSIIGTTGNAGQVNYSAAKAGLEGLTRSLAQEIASRNITVNAIAPGFIATDMTDGLPENQKEAILASIPMKRMGTTHEIAGSVAFLASDDAAYITGQTIHVNGGMNMG
jgi:3-oxoacyl-[acyl-carrier protein] reductase